MNLLDLVNIEKNSAFKLIKYEDSIWEVCLMVDEEDIAEGIKGSDVCGTLTKENKVVEFYLSTIKEFEKVSTVEINGEQYEILKEFKIRHLGWEMDNWGVVALKENKEKTLLLSNHGHWYESDEFRLEEIYNEQKAELIEMNEALFLLRL